MTYEVRTIIISAAGFLATAALVSFGSALPAFDRAVSEFVFLTIDSAWYAPFVVADDIGNAGTIFLLGAALTVLVFARRGINHAIVFAATLLLTEAFVLVSKLLIGRPRPLGAFEILSDPGFPSGHAALSTALLLLVIAMVFRGIRSSTLRITLGLLSAAAALLVCISRVALDVHYVSDVLAGVFLGTAVSFCAFTLLKKFEGGMRA